MSQTIDVMIAVDAASVLEIYGQNTDPENPVQITDPFIFMTTKTGNVVSGQGGNELRIKADTLDTIRWRETSLTLNAEYTTILYEFVPQGGENLISVPRAELAAVRVPLPNPDSPLEPGFQEIQNYFWNTIAERPGSVTYHFNFMIVDRHGNKLGYYWFDPFIEILE